MEKVWYEVEVDYRRKDGEFHEKWERAYLASRHKTIPLARQSFVKSKNIRNRIVKVTETREVVE